MSVFSLPPPGLYSLVLPRTHDPEVHLWPLPVPTAPGGEILQRQGLPGLGCVAPRRCPVPVREGSDHQGGAQLTPSAGLRGVPGLSATAHGPTLPSTLPQGTGSPPRLDSVKCTLEACVRERPCSCCVCVPWKRSRVREPGGAARASTRLCTHAFARAWGRVFVCLDAKAPPGPWCPSACVFVHGRRRFQRLHLCMRACVYTVCVRAHVRVHARTHEASTLCELTGHSVGH